MMHPEVMEGYQQLAHDIAGMVDNIKAGREYKKNARKMESKLKPLARYLFDKHPEGDFFDKVPFESQVSGIKKFELQAFREYDAYEMVTNSGADLVVNWYQNGEQEIFNISFDIFGRELAINQIVRNEEIIEDRREKARILRHMNKAMDLGIVFQTSG